MDCSCKQGADIPLGESKVTSKDKRKEKTMIYSPVEITVQFEKTNRKKNVKGVLLGKSEMKKVVKLIDKTNSDGLKGNDAVLLIRLKEALSDLD